MADMPPRHRVSRAPRRSAGRHGTLMPPSRAEDGGNFGGRSRPREQVALAERAALVAQGGELRGRLDPSATTSRSSVLARPMIEETIAASSRSVYRSRTKLRSIFSRLTGKRFR